MLKVFFFNACIWAVQFLASYAKKKLKKNRKPWFCFYDKHLPCVFAEPQLQSQVYATCPREVKKESDGIIVESKLIYMEQQVKLCGWEADVLPEGSDRRARKG